jgi:hypothetical protein
LPAPDLSGLGEVHALLAVAWSHDGQELLAGGQYPHVRGPVLAWSNGGAGPRRLLIEANSTVQNLIALSDGGVLEADQASLSALGPDGRLRWSHQAPIANFIGQFDLLKVSTDGTRVGFGYEPFAKSAYHFDMGARTLVPELGSDAEWPLQN